MTIRSFAPVAAAVGVLMLIGGCRQPSAKDAVATYAYSDGVYAETIALRPNGQFLQTESPLPGMHTKRPAVLSGHKQTWHLLDKPDGKPLSLPASANLLPPDAVVELNNAMPFGLVFENQAYHGYVTRTLPAREFKIKSP